MPLAQRHLTPPEAHQCPETESRPRRRFDFAAAFGEQRQIVVDWASISGNYSVYRINVVGLPLNRCRLNNHRPKNAQNASNSRRERRRLSNVTTISEPILLPASCPRATNGAIQWRHSAVFGAAGGIAVLVLHIKKMPFV